MQTQQMDCAQFVLKVGLNAALKIFGEQVWDEAKLTFEQWNNYSDWVVHNQAFDAKITAKLVETASTSSHWLQLWGIVPAESSLRPLIIEKIRAELKILATFDQVQNWKPMSMRFDSNGKWKDLNAVWLERFVEVATSVWHCSMVREEARHLRVGNKDLAAKALAKMVDCAIRTGTVEDWERVYHETPVGSHTRQALAYFADQAKTFEDWYNVWYRAKDKDKDSDLAKIAWQKIINRASTFQEWRSIFWQNEANYTITQEWCASKVRKLAKTFEDWSSLYTSNNSDSIMKADALAQMLAKVETLDDWYKVWHWTPEGSEVKTQALEKVRSFVNLR